MGSAPPPLNTPPVLPVSPQGSLRVRWRIHLVLVGFFPVAIGLLSLGQGERARAALGTNVLQLLQASALEIGLFGVVLGLAWLASRFSAEDLMLRWRGGWHPVPLGIAYSVGLRIAVAICAGIAAAVLLLFGIVTLDQLQHYLIAKRPDLGAVVDVSALKEQPGYFWLNVTLVSFVLGGLREELWRAAFIAGMRRLWPGHFGSRMGGIVAAGIAAAAFGAGHALQGPLAVGLTGLLGFGLGLIMVFHRSIWPAVFAHGFFNATSFALLPLIIDKLPKVS
jgi:membrane protease YdiL (CAAX protease family)